MVRGAQAVDQQAANRLGFGKHLALLQQITRPKPLNVYPDNQTPLAIFRRMQTQWRYASAGMGAARIVGMDWSILPRHEAALGLDERARIAVFADLELLELAWLEEHAQLVSEQQGRG